MPDDRDPDFEVANAALTVAREALASQQAEVRDRRTAAAALLTASALIVSFLGGRAIDRGTSALLAVLGLLLFVASLGVSFVVLIPALFKDRASRGSGGPPRILARLFGSIDLREIGSGSALLQIEPSPSGPALDVHAIRRLTATYDQISDLNRRPMRRMTRLLGVAAVLLLLEVAAWATMLGFAPSAPTTAATARPCTPATIAGSRGCLARGQRCDLRRRPAYERYGFICTRRAGDGRARLR